jgi:molecular chaperone GrpE
MDEENTIQEDLETTPDLERELAEAKEEAQTNLNGWKRAQADFENYKRRKEEENKDLIDFAREVAVTKMLPSLDSLTQALLLAPKEDDPALAENYIKWKVGLVGLTQQIDKALTELGVKKIEAKGKKFDPNYHEAVREVEGKEDGMVVEELMHGYEINGKVIRPSQVVISKKSI